MYSVPIASQWLGYFEDQIEFVSSLPEELQRQVLVRAESEDYDLEQENRWLKSFPKIKFENGERCTKPNKSVRTAHSVCRLFCYTVSV